VISLRRSRSSPLARFVACVLVSVLVLAAIPTAAEPSLLGQNPSYPIQDELYRLTSDTVTIGALNQYSKGFIYDDVGNRQTQTTTIGPAGSTGGALVAGTLTYGYDARDRLTSGTLDANPATTYGWDVDGNLITKSGEATYEWDREMRMVRVTKTDGTVVEHTYDFDGVRVQTRTTPAGGGASTTNYLVDTSGSLSHVIAETNAAGGLVAHYVRGGDLLAVMRPLVPVPASVTDWQTRYYHSDHIGSVRRLTDEAGVVTDWYVYTAFGTLLGHGGTDVQPYAFTGEPYDPNVGFQYHRARWMDPKVGRFSAMDAWSGSRFEPVSLHRYLYGNADPVGHRDPSGKTSLAESNAVLSNISTLSQTALRVMNILDRVETFVDAITLVAQIASLAQNGQFKLYLQEAFDTFKHQAAELTFGEVADNLARNLPFITGHAAGPWSAWLGLNVKNVKGLIVSLPNPGLSAQIPIPTGLRVGKLPVLLLAGGKTRAFSLLGIGLHAPGMKGVDKYQQVWRMDFHPMHSTHTSPREGDEIAVWQDQPFHYHVLEPRYAR
jgi:RHS repeat-associated protein